ncbi:g3880 [Coccomyxa elongata]
MSCQAATSSDSNRDSSREEFNRKAYAFGRAATKTLKQTAEVVGDNVRRVAGDVDSRFDVSGKASKAAQGVKEQASAVDERFGVKRKIRNLADDAVRRYPMWKRQYAEFSKTTAGQIVFFAAFFFVCYSGLIWRILNLLFILWWIAPLFVLPAINYLNKKAAEEMAARQQAQQRAAQNPFFGAFNRAQARQQGTPRPGRGAAPGGRSDGPVIDVEYSTLDDE